MPKSRLLIIDDNATVRDVLAIVLEPCEEVEICASAKCSAEALESVKSANPDMALVDLSLKGDNGLTLIGDLRVLYPELKIIAYSLHDEAFYIEAAKTAGADAYVIKSERPKVLLETLRSVQQGDNRFPEPGK